jgi:hypothetical protein
MRPSNIDVSSLGHVSTDLLGQATNVLRRELARLPSVLSAVPVISSFSSTPPEPTRAGTQVAEGECPVTGVAPSGGKYDKHGLRSQAHELLAGVLTLLYAPAPGNPARPGPEGALQHLRGTKCPITGAELPTGGLDRDRVRRQAHTLIETLLVTLNDATQEQGLPAEDRVPLIHCAAAVQPGSVGHASLTIANEERSAAQVTLYSSDFVADTGFEIPALRVTFSPRTANIPGSGQHRFEIAIGVSQQTPRGVYSGLVQAAGSRYVKAVVSVEVL